MSDLKSDLMSDLNRDLMSDSKSDLMSDLKSDLTSAGLLAAGAGCSWLLLAGWLTAAAELSHTAGKVK